MLREGDTQNAIMSLDDFLAGTLYRTAVGVPDDKMRELKPDILRVWQEVKEYFDTYKIEEGVMIYPVRRKLARVPWSDVQVAVKKFEQTYKSGEKAPAPSINIKKWLGQSLSSEELKGKVILLDFWNIYCVPCIKSFPKLQKIHDTYKEKGLAVIACAGGDNEKTKEFLDKHGYNFPAGMASNQMFLDYAIRVNPTYFLIDRDGYLVWGPEQRLPTDEELTSLLLIK
jgi:thiol-disulfide isomerase/thioredoxin